MTRFVHRWRLWLLLAAVLLLVGGAWGLSLLRERKHTETVELDRLIAQAQVVERNLVRQLTAINLSLLFIQEGLSGWQGSPPGQANARQTLVGMAAAMSAVDTFLVTDARGNVTFSNRDDLLGRNVYPRDYVQAPLKTLDATRLYVSLPFKSELSRPEVNLSRVLLDKNGQFAGVVSAAIDLVDFEILLNSVRYSDDMQVALLHGDGDMVISQPALVQEGLLDPSLLRQHLLGRLDVSHFSGALGAAKTPSLTVLRTVSPSALAMDRPLVAVLSRELAVIDAPWQQAARNQSAVYLLLVLLSVFGLSVFQRHRAQKIVAVKRLKLATEASGVGIWEFDLVTKRYQWDNAMFALFGLDPKRASPRNDEWTKLLNAADLRRMREDTRATIRQDQPFDMTFEIRRPDGQVRFMRNRAALYSDDEGLPSRLIGVTEDVTPRKQLEADLRVAAVAFESHQSMLVTNAKMEILRVNHAFSSLFGYAASEVIGKNPRLLKSGRQEADFYYVMWSELQLRHSWQGEIWNTGKGGAEFPCWLSITAVCDDAGAVTHYVATHTDITLRKATEDEVKRLAFFDPLTNLPNRRLLTDRLMHAVTHAKRDQGHLALIFVDLDKFKPVNDRYGHAAGDLLLQSVAHRLRTCVRESDTVARVGGDEFVVLLDGIRQSLDAMQVAEKIHAVLLEPFRLVSGQSVHISSSAGIAMYPEHGQDEATLSHHADVAMYAAKSAGRDQYVVFDPALDQPNAVHQTQDKPQDKPQDHVGQNLA